MSAAAGQDSRPARTRRRTNPRPGNPWLEGRNNGTTAQAEMDAATPPRDAKPPWNARTRFVSTLAMTRRSWTPDSCIPGLGTMACAGAQGISPSRHSGSYPSECGDAGQTWPTRHIRDRPVQPSVLSPKSPARADPPCTGHSTMRRLQDSSITTNKSVTQSDWHSRCHRARGRKAS